MHTLSQNTQSRRIAPDGTAATTFQLAAGTTDKDSSVIDTDGYDGLQIKVFIGPIVATGTLTITVKSSTASAGTYAAVTGLATTLIDDTSDDKMIIFDVPKCGKRYYKVSFDRGTANSTIDALEAVLYNPREAPTSVHSTVLERLVASANA